MTARIILAVVCAAATATGVAAQQYPNPTPAELNQYRNNPCSDPWISKGYINASAGTQVAAGKGVEGECNPKLFNGGQWNSYQQLVTAIAAYRNGMYRNGLALRGNSVAQGLRLSLTQNGTEIGWRLIGHDGATLIGQDGAGIVAGGGLNLQSVSKTSKLIAPGVYLVR